MKPAGAQGGEDVPVRALAAADIERATDEDRRDSDAELPAGAEAGVREGGADADELSHDDAVFPPFRGARDDARGKQPLRDPPPHFRAPVSRRSPLARAGTRAALRLQHGS